ncbi:MAG: Excinuclease subunit [Ignavibacteria bacterium]|nr:Excinuclease subunit [Ignavibacteria bacterium]
MAKKNNNINNTSQPMPGLTSIRVFGAREHNLKNININIPRDKFVVITGLSGSGKSSLAFDTIYAEGQRRYVECLSPYARQFLGMMKKPDVDRIEGLSPSISIEQKTLSHNPRSTVGTVTEIYDYIRLLFAKIGTQHCTDCGIPVEQKTLDRICEEIMTDFSGRKIYILAPLVRGRKGHYKELFEQLIKLGFSRVRVDGEILRLHEGINIARYKAHNIELVVDRCEVNLHQSQRISESVELAMVKGEGTLMIVPEMGEEGSERLFSSSYSCPSCGKSFEPLAPNMFSFNSPYGACPHCEGMGEIKDFDMGKVIPDMTKSVEEGGIASIGAKQDDWLWLQILSLAEQFKIDLSLPIKDLKVHELELLMYGTEEKTINMFYEFAGGSKIKYKQKFIGILPTLRHKFETSYSLRTGKYLQEYFNSLDCPYCGGSRLKRDSISVRIQDKNINDIVSLDILKTFEYFIYLKSALTERQLSIAKQILHEISSRFEFLIDVGLSYLTLKRQARTLSGGEHQRIRLASQIGSKLVGITYILDEPSIGLHQRDNDKLISSLKKLCEMGNSIIVVEHDKAMITQAEYIIDMGPGAGKHGGHVILAATNAELMSIKPKELEKSLTAQYILSKKEIEVPANRRNGNGKEVVLKGANGNNLKSVDLKIPLGKSVCITGMSGSGKSSLINDTLYPILARHFYSSSVMPLKYSSVEGLEYIDKVIEIDQSPIGRTPRSNPATYTGLFTLIRDFFALMPESKIRGYKAGRFSFNVKGGRCDECEGAGIKKIEMNFLPEVYVECDSCNGKRYNRETLGVKFKGKSIADVLDMTVGEAIEFFSEIPKIKAKLSTLCDVGMSYIHLGQQAPTLSGGEAQRVKLAAELSKTSTGKTLYLLDEPTTGLHFEDIRILLNLLDKLVDKGNTVVIIEHNLDVVKCCDWVIDLGPEGGDAGGRIIAEGTPELVANTPGSYTGEYLKKELKMG